jgi:ATP-dependent RNA helicase DeaD
MHEHDAALIFVRTKTATEELSEQLTQAGFFAAALHGDIQQAQRERVVGRLKSGKLDVVVATDVVARGLDVERISHVINFDIPYDVESYVHRIGRTGRAGRQGDAVLFVTHRERRLLKSIERHTRSPLETLELPDAKALNQIRAQRLKERLVNAIDKPQTADFHNVISELVTESGITASALAAAALQLIYKDKPFYLDEKEPSFKERPRRERPERGERGDRGERKPRRDSGADEGKTRYWIGVGHQDGVKPGNIVGAIANEANISSDLIGRISISENFSTIDLPNDLKHPQLKKISDARVCGKQLSIRPWQDEMSSKPTRRKGPPRDRNIKPKSNRKPRTEKA